MRPDVGHEVLEAEHHPVDEIPQEADRVRNDVRDHAGRLSQHAEQHVLEGEDLLDQADRGIVDTLP